MYEHLALHLHLLESTPQAAKASYGGQGEGEIPFPTTYGTEFVDDENSVGVFWDEELANAASVMCFVSTLLFLPVHKHKSTSSW